MGKTYSVAAKISRVISLASTAGGTSGKDSQRRGHVSQTLKNHHTTHLLHWIIWERTDILTKQD